MSQSKEEILIMGSLVVGRYKGRFPEAEEEVNKSTIRAPL